MAGKLVHEVLAEINKDPNLLFSKYQPINGGGPLGVLFKHAFIPKYKFLLPDGEPPYRKDDSPLGLSPSKVQSEIRKFYIFIDEKIPATKRENAFIQMLESVHSGEAAVLVAVKDQNLTTMYPNITRKRLIDAGFLPPLVERDASGEAVSSEYSDIQPKVDSSVETVEGASKPRPARSRPRKQVDFSQL